VIDLHSHILPGVDDGPVTLEESLDMARAAVADGIEAIAATPHVRDDYPTSPDTMERLVAELREALVADAIPLELLPGGEIALDRLDDLSPDDLRRFGLGGSEAHVLLEFPYVGWPLALEDRVFRLAAEGVRAVIAHPERNGEVQLAPERLEPIVRAGGLVQLTAASLDGRLGQRSRRAGLVLLERGLAHLLASDAHTPDIRGIGMSAAAEAIGDVDLAHWLTVDAPAAIVSGEEIPPRPDAPHRRWWRRG
jgi:protein-tyrosine phosphatase